jgi:hypothetical protein
MLDNYQARSKIPDNRAKNGGLYARNHYYPTGDRNYPQSDAMDNPCRHPRVQIVSRDEDAEYVECLECREIFESSEFKDMDIEAKIPTEEE